MDDSADRPLNPALLAGLRESTLLADLDEAALRELLPEFRHERWPKRAPVMPPAKTAERFYLLLRGRVRIEAQHPANARAVTLHLLGPGDGHSLICLLDGGPQHVLAETLDAVEAVSAPLARWQAWLETYPSIRRAALRCAAQRLRELAELAEDLALHDTSARFAHLLLRHLDAAENGHGLLHDLVHEDIAHLIGSVRVVVNRLINRFKHEGIVHTEAGQIHVADLERLMRKAEHRRHGTRRGSAPPNGPDRSPPL